MGASRCLAVSLAVIAGCGGGGGGGGEGSAAPLLRLTAHCQGLPGPTPCSTDEGEPPTVPICQLDGAFFWRSDMDIDCDGGTSAICRGDPDFQPETSATDSAWNPLDASALPFAVVPLPSNGFDYIAQDIQ